MYEQIAHFLNRGSTRPTLVGFIFAWITTKSVYCGHICDGPAQSSISRFHSLQNRLPVLVAEAYCYSVALAIANFPFFSFSSLKLSTHLKIGISIEHFSTKLILWGSIIKVIKGYPHWISIYRGHVSDKYFVRLFCNIRLINICNLCEVLKSSNRKTCLSDKLQNINGRISRYLF